MTADSYLYSPLLSSLDSLKLFVYSHLHLVSIHCATPSVQSILKYAASKLSIVYGVSTSLLASVLAFALADCRNCTRTLPCKERLLLRSNLVVVMVSGEGILLC